MFSPPDLKNKLILDTSDISERHLRNATMTTSFSCDPMTDTMQVFAL